MVGLLGTFTGGELGLFPPISSTIPSHNAQKNGCRWFRSRGASYVDKIRCDELLSRYCRQPHVGSHFYQSFPMTSKFFSWIFAKKKERKISRSDKSLGREEI